MLRYLIAIPLVIFLVLFSPSCSLGLPRDLPSYPRYDSLSFFLHSLPDITKFNTVLSFLFTYQSEVGDYWKNPEEFFRDRGGDCEDFAIFVAYVFKRKGWAYQSYVVIVETPLGLVHALAVAEGKRAFYIYDVQTPYVFPKDGTPFLDRIKTLGYHPIKVYTIRITAPKDDDRPQGCSLEGGCRIN
ncbi:transglutaminase-like domain-containing protein [Candidatus Caldatribacterium sp.]|uniref:transglutaminase-like domain-containing protein n=1 Tax=Candidatus Caldatribacterium sp. TaxID=2282143 RepID=UPI0038432C43|nr:hypothetical protein [Candidatus Caldatribacterium sp.]